MNSTRGYIVVSDLCGITQLFTILPPVQNHFSSILYWFVYDQVDLCFRVLAKEIMMCCLGLLPGLQRYSIDINFVGVDFDNERFKSTYNSLDENGCVAERGCLLLQE